MRYTPQLQTGAKTTLMTSAFYGYNHNKIIADGEMFEMKNMSGDDYPLLSLRKKRGISSYDTQGEAQVPLNGIHGRDQLVFIRGTDVYYNFVPVQGLSVSADTGMLPKKIVSFGAYVCIWPDKKYFNTADQSDYGSMERLFSASSAGVSLIMCRNDGTDYDYTSISRGTSAPEDPANGQLWLDESGSEAVLRQYMKSADEWLEVTTTYIKIQCTGIGSGLKEYDTIELSGMALGGADPDERVAAQVEALNGSMIVYACGENYIIVAGLLSAAVEAEGLAEGTVHADLKLPDLDYVVQSNNRLWGCKYGMVNGEVVNEIYASKLGDFRNWRNYMGLSTDSYTASVGTDGQFTGAITQRGYPVFFKENCIHRVSGTTPDSFTIQTTHCRGVQKGSWKSLAVVAENIYYKAREGIMVYDGNMPQIVSEQLGDELYSDARAGVLKDKYYICMKDKDNTFIQYVYDTTHGTWWVEDNMQALGYGAVDDELFLIDEVSNTLVSIRGTIGTEEGDLDWAATFDLYGVNYQRQGNYDDPKRVRNEKYVSLFKIRMELEDGAWMRLYMQYNGGKWEYMGEKRGNNLRTFVLPIVPKRCDHVRFKIEGRGQATIYDISRIMEVGGDG